MIDSTGTEAFAMEHKLAKLLRELKWTPVRYYKKLTGFFCMSVTLNLLCFGAFLQDN